MKNDGLIPRFYLFLDNAFNLIRGVAICPLFSSLVQAVPVVDYKELVFEFIIGLQNLTAVFLVQINSIELTSGLCLTFLNGKDALSTRGM